MSPDRFPKSLSPTSEQYAATPEPTVRRIPPTRCLHIGGSSPPGSASFQNAVRALYSVAYTIRFDRQRKGPPYRVGALEGLYRRAGNRRGLPKAGESMAWELLIPIPSSVGAAEIARARRLLSDRGKPSRFRDVRIETLREGLSVEALHVGPYSAEGETIARMRRAARAAGRSLRGPHHEIYLSDPRRVKASKWRTILRYPLGPDRPPRSA